MRGGGAARRGRRPYLWYAAAADDSELCERRVPAAGLCSCFLSPSGPTSSAHFAEPYSSATAVQNHSRKPSSFSSPSTCAAEPFSVCVTATGSPSSGKPKGKATRKRISNEQQSAIVFTEKIQGVITGLTLSDGYLERCRESVRLQIEKPPAERS